MAAKGSILFKLLIVVFIAALVAVIYIPDQIWTEEDSMLTTSRENMNAIYEAQHLHYTRNKRYLPSDSLGKLVEFVRTDSALLEKQKIGKLTNQLHNGINALLQTPILQAMGPISGGISEINGDLDFNTRYFQKYDAILAKKDEVKQNLRRFSSSLDYTNFNMLKLYSDSLNILNDRLNEYTLQQGAQLSQAYTDSVLKYLPKAELTSMGEYWRGEYANIDQMVKDIKQTDIVMVSSVADRLKKFIDRVNTGMGILATVDVQQDARTLEQAKNELANIYTEFTQPENLFSTQRNGILTLSEIDSVLLKFNEKNFYDPDTFDGEQTYIVHFKDTSAAIVVESPNLLTDFQNKLTAATEPIANLSIYPYLGKIQEALDSTATVMIAEKDKHRLARYSTDLLLDMKELTTEMGDISNLRFTRYTQNLKTFVDTIKTERRLSALKPIINDYILTTGIDSLASKIENRDISDLEAKMNEFGTKIQALDSLVVASVPARVSRNIEPFYDTFAGVFSVLNELKSACNPDDGQKIRQASAEIQTALTEILNGYEEKVYGVFSKKHINHGYIENGQKSWELDGE